jgi:hypothetical protein
MGVLSRWSQRNNSPLLTDMFLLPETKHHCSGGKSKASEISAFQAGWLTILLLSIAQEKHTMERLSRVCFAISRRLQSFLP